MSEADRQAALVSGDRGLSPQESLALIRAQRAGAVRSLSPNPVAILGSWGLAWLLGFGACYLASAARPGPASPGWAAYVVLDSLCAAAMVITVTQLRRSGRGVAGRSRAVAAMYGWSWALGCAAAYAVDFALASHGMPARLLPLLWPGTTLLVVGVLYLAGGAIWQDRLSYCLGAWTLLVAVASVAAGVPANFALLALAGGGGLLAAAVFALRGASWRVRR